MNIFLSWFFSPNCRDYLFNVCNRITRWHIKKFYEISCSEPIFFAIIHYGIKLGPAHGCFTFDFLEARKRYCKWTSLNRGYIIKIYTITTCYKRLYNFLIITFSTSKDSL